MEDDQREEEHDEERDRFQGALYAIEQLLELVEEDERHGANINAANRNDALPWPLEVERPRERLNEYRELIAARFLAHQFARRMRVAVHDLEEERNMMRQAVIDRGLIDPDDRVEVDRPRLVKFPGLDHMVTPDSLTRFAVSALVKNYKPVELQRYVEILPSDLVYRIHKEMYLNRMFVELGDQWTKMEFFEKVLMLKCKRIKLHRMYEVVRGTIPSTLPSRLIRDVKKKATCALLQRRSNPGQLKKMYNVLLELGTFFLECLNYACAGDMFELCRKLLRDMPLSSEERDREIVRMNYHLLVYYTGCCEFDKARVISAYFDTIFAGPRMNGFKDDTDLDYGQILIQCAVLWQQMGDYKRAVGYVVESLKTVVYRKMPTRTLVNIFRLSAKILMSVRQLSPGARLIRHAVYVAFFNYNSYRRFPQVLLDYAFCLVNLDHVKQAVSVYMDAIDFMEDIFGNSSVCLSQAYEEMAYALYVLEYTTGDFAKASAFAEKAVMLNKFHLPHNHMLIATSRRMKALIMEEQALNERDESVRNRMLQQALCLHTDALQYYQRRFGDENIFTAKNYGNLGRLYQSLRDFEKSEEMHLKAIAIKKRVVGENDYETALSLGHLAALYTNDMNRHEEAKDLYLKSAEIATRIFGESFTGLQYDYRGLHRVYLELGDEESARYYHIKLIDWAERRRLNRDGKSLRIWSDIPYERPKTPAVLALQCLQELSAAGYC